MKPFVRTEYNLPKFNEFMTQMKADGFTKHQINVMWQDLQRDILYTNDLYQVAVDPEPWKSEGSIVSEGDPIVHLSIKRLDREPIHDWRHLQQIKNEIVGEEFEAVEIYPAQKRIVDTANQYHLFVFTDPEIRIKVGWDYGSPQLSTNLPGVKQREFDND